MLSTNRLFELNQNRSTEISSCLLHQITEKFRASFYWLTLPMMHVTMSRISSDGGGMNKDGQAVAALVGNASSAVVLEQVRQRLDVLTERDFSAVAALLDLLSNHPSVSSDESLLGSVSALKTVFVRLWDDTEAVLS